MESDVVEVVARFGSTILDVAHVGPLDRYRIGTAPGTQLVVPGLTSFPLVDGRTVRCPVGIPATEHDGATELSVGALTIRITRSKLARAPVARPRPDWRAPAFVLGSLLVHLAIWFVAMAFAPFERVATPRAPRLRLAHIDVPPPPKPTPEPRKRALASETQPQPALRVAGGERRRRTKQHARRGYEESMPDVNAAVARMLESFDDIQIQRRLDELDSSTAYNPELDSGSFGAGNALDPNNREGWGTVEAGPYEIIPFDVKLCPDKSCTVKGPVPALYVRTHLHHHMDAIYDCYERYADGPGTIVLEFTITADGAVRDARGSGLGETGACAANVASEIFFKAFGKETHVRYPVRFGVTIR